MEELMTLYLYGDVSAVNAISSFLTLYRKKKKEKKKGGGVGLSCLSL